MPGDPRADLVGRQQGRQVAPLVELDPPDLLEQGGVRGVAGVLPRLVVRLFGDLDQPLEERAGGGGHLALLGVRGTPRSRASRTGTVRGRRRGSAAGGRAAPASAAPTRPPKGFPVPPRLPVYPFPTGRRTRVIALYVRDNRTDPNLLAKTQTDGPLTEQHRDMWPTRAETAGEAAGSAWAARAGGETDIYLRTRQEAENFPVALRALPAEVRAAPARGVRRGARHRRPRRRGPGDRTALLTRLPAPTSAPIWAGGEPQAPVLRRLAPHGARVRPVATAVRRPGRGQPARPGPRPRTPRSTTCSTTAALSANPVGLLVLRRLRRAQPGPGGAVRPDLHRAAGHRALPGRRPRTGAPGGSTCRWRTSTGSASRRPTSTPREPSRAAAPRWSRSRRSGPSELLASGLPLLGELRGLGPAGGRRLRRRRPGRRLPRCAAPTGTVLAGASTGPPSATSSRELVDPGDGPAGGGVVNSTVAEAYDVCASITRSRRATSTTASACCRPTSAARCAPCTRWPAAIDDIGDGDLPAATKATALAAVARRPARHRPQHRPGAGRGRRHRPPLPDAAGRVRRAGRRRRDGRHRHAPTRRSTTSSATAGAWPARSAGCASACSARGPTRAPRSTPTRSGSPCSRPTSCATSARTCSNGRVYLPSEDLDRFGVTLELDASGDLADRDGELAALIAFAAERARGWYDRGLRLLPLLDRRSAACAGGHVRASTAGCSTGSTPTRRSSTTAGCRCPAGRRPAWRSAPWRGSAP